MSALYLVANDVAYYKNYSDIKKFNTLLSDCIAKIKESDKKSKYQKELFKWFDSAGYKSVKQIIISPNEEQIKENIANDEVMFLSWSYPKSDITDLLIIQELPIIDGLLTMQEKSFDISQQESLVQKLNLEVIQTSQSYKDMAGASFQIEILEDMFRSFSKHRVRKLTLFLLGIPGAGKTFLAQCLAGEKGRLLIKLDLSRMIEMDRPIQRLHYFFKWLQMLHYQGQHVVVLLDEIAQALRGGNYLQNQFKGQMLTVIEDLNTQSGYQIGETFIIATDNNIREIMNETPQFMARWEELFFLNFPKEEEAKAILKHWLNFHKAKYCKEHSEISNHDLDMIYINIKEYYDSEKIEYDGNTKRFIYAPREIAKFSARFATISERYFEENENEIELNKNVIIGCCKRVPPQQKMLKLGISRMINDAGSGFIEI